MLRLPAGLIIAAAAFTVVIPLAATAKSYQPCTVDSTHIEGRLSTRDGSTDTPESCEKKGKSWKAMPNSGWTDAECNDTSGCAYGTQTVPPLPDGETISCANAGGREKLDCSCQK
tara:strand:+ start:2458 stop:2802 length:345 start_codon:yes stop_codon:yes gene_type:complete